MSDRCEITELIADECAHCVTGLRRTRSAPRPGRPGPWFSASFDSVCDDCGEWIPIGDPVSYGTGGYACVDCGGAL